MYRYCRHKVHPRCGCRSARARKWPAIRVNWPCDGGHWPVPPGARPSGSAGCAQSAARWQAPAEHPVLSSLPYDRKT